MTAFRRFETIEENIPVKGVGSQLSPKSGH